MLPASIGSVEVDGNTLSVYIDNPDAPTDMTFRNNVKVSSASEVPAAILDAAGRQ